MGHNLGLVVVKQNGSVVSRGNRFDEPVEHCPVASSVFPAHLRVTQSAENDLRARNVAVHKAEHRHEHAYGSFAACGSTFVCRTNEHVTLEGCSERLGQLEHLRVTQRQRACSVARPHAHSDVALVAQAQSHERARVVSRPTHDLARRAHAVPSSPHASPTSCTFGNRDIWCPQRCGWGQGRRVAEGAGERTRRDTARSFTSREDATSYQ